MLVGRRWLNISVQFIAQPEGPLADTGGPSLLLIAENDKTGKYWQLCRTATTSLPARVMWGAPSMTLEIETAPTGGRQPGPIRVFLQQVGGATSQAGA
jgi:hypothetical protein